MRRNFLKSLATATASAFCLKPSEAKQVGVITTIVCGDITYFACDGSLFKVESKYNTFWYQNGKLHREDGPACEYLSGTNIWLYNGLYHRVDGPAVKFYDGTKEWYFRGKRHRTDGPAVEKADGTKEWWIDGKCLEHGIELMKDGSSIFVTKR
jgi:hypothetical protein